MLKKVIGLIVCAIIIGLMIYGITTGNTALPILVILLMRLVLPFIFERC